MVTKEARLRLKELRAIDKRKRKARSLDSMFAGILGVSEREFKKAREEQA